MEGKNRTYNVGPGQKYAELTEVPWLSLRAGDVVNIFRRPQPYRTKIGLRAQGSAKLPVVINGVTDAQCNRPEISGQDAVTASDAAHESFFSKQYSEFLGTIFLYKAPSDRWGYRPTYITIQNLKITGARPTNHYTAQDGSSGTYAAGAAGIYAVVVEHLTIENCEITGNGNGVFVNSRSEDDASAYITLRRNHIYDNGVVDSYHEHNLYVQAARSLYEGNTIGQLIPGARGSSLKDRSSGTVIRYNRIDAAARAIDLVEIEGGVAPILNDPVYPDAWVYGNLIVSDFWSPALASSLLIHWGGDNDPRYFRKGTLHFYNNTVVTRANRAQTYYVAIFDMPTAEQTVELRANVFAHYGSALPNLGYTSGRIRLTGSNWIARGEARGWKPEVNVEQQGATVLTGNDPGLLPDYVPTPNSPLIDHGDGAAKGGESGLPPVLMQYAAPLGYVPRVRTGIADDLGAFERR